MRILMLYTPRSGSTSIFNYFKKLKESYQLISQPWSPLVSEIASKDTIKYYEILEFKDVFVKSTINLFFYKQLDTISYEQIKKDFDKIIILSRKNQKEQAESLAHASKHRTFLEDFKYQIDSDLGSFMEQMHEVLDDEKTKIPELVKNLNAKLFYYEDLYYGNFTDLFNYLEIDYVEEHFEKLLNINNKYRLNDSLTKKIKSLI